MTATTDPAHVVWQVKITRAMVEHLSFKELCSFLDELHQTISPIIEQHTSRKER